MKQLGLFLCGWLALMLTSEAAVDRGAPKKAKNAAPTAARPTRPGGAPTSFTTRTFKTPDGKALDYSLFVPATIAAGQKLPLVLCLHGSGGSTEAARVLAATERQAKHPCLIMAPACDPATHRWVDMPFRSDAPPGLLAELLGALDEVSRKYPVDPDRIYITGQSMGGVGTWGISVAHPELFAAAVPVCGIWPPTDAPKMAQVPVWAFHGDKDARVPVDGSRQMIAALKAAGGSPRYTEYPGVGHNSWTAAYATDELWDWLFAQGRKSP